MKELEKSLTGLGFSPKKAEIYLALLELGEASVIEIAKKTKLKRTTVYNILPELLQEGLVKASSKGGRKFFFVEDPRSIKIAIEEKLRIANHVVPELAAIQNIIPHKPRITFYEGEGGMRDLYADTLESVEQGGTIFSYTGLSDFYKLVPKEFARWYIDERVKRKIQIRVITPQSEVASEWKENGTRELRSIKIVDNPNFHFNADMEIYGNKVALISYRENFLGVIIESAEINQMQRAAFEMMWNSLK